jgi:tetratricopeptide (TPR) repeat protein
VAYLLSGNYAKAEPLLNKVFEHQMQTLGLDNEATIDTSDSLARLYLNERQYDKAEKLLANGLVSCRRIFGPQHPNTLREMYGLASAYTGEGKYAQAETLLLQVLEGNTKLLGADHPNTFATMSQLAALYGKEGKFEQAVALSERVFEGYSRVQGREHPNTLSVEGNLGLAYQQAGQIAKAERTMKDTIARQMRVVGPKHPGTQQNLTNLATLYEQEHRYAEAIPVYMQVRENAGQSLGPNDRRIAGSTMSIGRDYLMLRDYTKAEKELLSAQAMEIKSEPDHWRRFFVDNLLGGALLGEKKYSQAEPLLVSGYGGFKDRESKVPPSAKVYITEAGERVVQLYKAWGKPAQAEEWRNKLAGASETPAAKQQAKP